MSSKKEKKTEKEKLLAKQVLCTLYPVGQI